MTTKGKAMCPLNYQQGSLPKLYDNSMEIFKDAKNNDVDFIRAVKLASRSYNEINSLRDPSSCPPKKVRTQGAGHKRKAPEVRISLFNWFIDVRETLKGRLS